MAAAVAIGSAVYSLLIYLPAAEKNQKERDENSPSYKILDHLAPTVFASLLVLVGTGIYFLLVNYTSQTGLKPGYYNLFGIKMIFVAGAFFISMYLAFSLRVQISDLDLNPKNKVLVRKLNRLGNILNISCNKHRKAKGNVIYFAIETFILV